MIPPAWRLRLSRSQQSRLGLFPLVVVVLWVYYAYGLAPACRGVALGWRQVRTARQQLRDSHNALAQEPRLRQEQTQLLHALEGLRGAVPWEEELPSTIQALSEAASQSGVKIQTITPERSPESLGLKPPAAKAKTAKKGSPSVERSGVGLHREIPIHIDAVAGFHQLGAFVSRVESGPQAMRLQTLQITSERSKESRRHEVKVTWVGHFATKGPEG